MYSKQNSLQHPDLSIKQGKALVSELKKVQEQNVGTSGTGLTVWISGSQQSYCSNIPSHGDIGNDAALDWHRQP